MLFNADKTKQCVDFWHTLPLTKWQTDRYKTQKIWNTYLNVNVEDRSWKWNAPFLAKVEFGNDEHENVKRIMNVTTRLNLFMMGRKVVFCSFALHFMPSTLLLVFSSWTLKWMKSRERNMHTLLNLSVLNYTGLHTRRKDGRKYIQETKKSKCSNLAPWFKLKISLGGKTIRQTKRCTAYYQGRNMSTSVALWKELDVFFPMLITITSVTLKWGQGHATELN